MDVLDVRIADHEIVLGNASYSGRALRLILAWPNPLNPKKGMVIYTAQKADDVVGILRWRRDDRDYVIADGERVLKVGNCYKEDDRWSFSDIPSTKFPSQAKKQLLQDFAWPIDLVRNVLPASLFSNQNSLEEGRHFEE